MKPSRSWSGTGPSNHSAPKTESRCQASWMGEEWWRVARHSWDDSAASSRSISLRGSTRDMATERNEGDHACRNNQSRNLGPVEIPVCQPAADVGSFSPKRSQQYTQRVRLRQCGTERSLVRSVTRCSEYSNNLVNPSHDRPAHSRWLLQIAKIQRKSSAGSAGKSPLNPLWRNGTNQAVGRISATSTSAFPIAYAVLNS